MGNVIVLGSLITDLAARATRLPHAGEALLGDEFGIFQGGKGFNQAIAAARLGASVTLIGRVGTDSFGDGFLDILRKEGLSDAYVGRDPTAGTGVACVMIGKDSGQNAIIVLPRANLALTPAIVTQAMQKILAQQNIHQGQQETHKGSPYIPGVFMAQCEMRLETIAAGLRLAHDAGLTTLFNAAPAPRPAFLTDLLSQVDILIVNESEASTIGNTMVNSTVAAQQAAAQLLELGPRQVIITLGEQGALWSHRSAAQVTSITHHWQPALSMTQVDATAAGDAFCGALAASLANGSSMAEALQRASAAGAITVTRLGAFPSLPTASEVEALLRSKTPPV